MALKDCRIIDLPKISDPRGNLTFIEGGRHIPFAVQRVYYVYDVPGGAARFQHGRPGHQYRPARLQSEAGKQLMLCLPFALPERVPFDISDQCLVIENR